MARLTDDEYKAIARRAYAALRRYPNVFGVGVGGRERGGHPTGEIVLKVFVSAKVDRGSLAAADIVPPEFEGVPTDIVEASTPKPHALSLVPGFRFSDSFVDDTSKYRPVKGGIQIQGSYRRGFGTLGFLARVTGDTRIMAITDYHVLFSGGTAPGPTVTVGNPDPDESCTKCCVGRVGTYVAGHYDPEVDIAIAKLDPGTKWLAEIEGVGVVKGKHAVTVAEATTLTYNVRKRGRTTGLTGGTVQAVGATFTETNEGLGARTCTNAVAVKPNPVSDGAVVRFAAPGDSGAAYVNDANEIVAVHFSGNYDQGEPTTGWGYGTDIQAIIDHFDIVDHIKLAPATATALNDVQTASSAAGETAPFEPSGDAEAMARRLEADLSESSRGRVMRDLWMRHSSELNNLVNSNRRVAVLWRRNGGPALFQHAISAAKQPGVAMPAAIDDRPVDELVERIIDAFGRHGSDVLKQDIAQHRAVLPQFAGRSYTDLLRVLHDNDRS